MAVTFDRHPFSVVAPQAVPPSLDDNDERLKRLRECGLVERVEVLKFDDGLRSLTAAQFMERLYAIGVRALLMGYDNSFGSDRLHGLEHYREIGDRIGIKVFESESVVKEGGFAVSSSVIRRLLGDGDVVLAERMLCRPYSLDGPVTRGRGEGRLLGFPTANIAVDPSRCIPKPGVYAATATCDAFEGAKPAMVNIGTCPTLTDGRKMTIEANIIGYEGDLYGRKMEIAFNRRLRDERKFGSVDELVAQLKSDREAVIGHGS